MSWNNIRQEINTNIADNDQQLITAEKVRTTLLDIVDETADLIEAIEYDLNNNIQAGTYQFLQDNYYSKTEIDDHLGDVYQDIYDLESNIYYITDDIDNRLSSIQLSYATKSYVSTYVSSYYYDKADSDKLYKPTGLFFYYGDDYSNECNCTVSYVNFINEDGPSGDFYLIEGSARIGGDNTLVFNINNPYGSMYSSTYSMGLYDVATEAFTKALGAGHTPQIHKFDQNITVIANYPNIQGNGIIMVGNVNCDDELIGDFTFSLVSAYEHTNLPLIINVGFKCWVQDVQ